MTSQSGGSRLRSRSPPARASTTARPILTFRSAGRFSIQAPAQWESTVGLMQSHGWEVVDASIVDTLVGNTEMADVVVEDNIFRMPLEDLTSKSKFFENAFRSDMVEGQSGSIPLRDESVDEFLEVLKFILPYSQEPELYHVDEDNIEVLKKWWDKYMIECIEKLCAVFRDFQKFESLAKRKAGEAAEFIGDMEDEEKANEYLGKLAQKDSDLSSEVRFRWLAGDDDALEGALEVLKEMDDVMAARILTSLGDGCYYFLEKLTENGNHTAASIAEKMDVDTLAYAMWESVSNFEWDGSWAKPLLAAMEEAQSKIVKAQMWRISGEVDEMQEQCEQGMMEELQDEY